MTRSDRAARRRSRSSAAALLALALAVALAAGCTEKLVAPPPPPPEFGTPDSVQQVFTQHCAFDGCHGGASPQQGMSLSDARTSYLAIVDVAANERQGQFKRIAPGDSANSYVVMKLRADPRIGGAPMPFGAYPMDPVLVLRIAAWAQAGAPGQELPAARSGPPLAAH